MRRPVSCILVQTLIMESATLGLTPSKRTPSISRKGIRKCQERSAREIELTFSTLPFPVNFYSKYYCRNKYSLTKTYYSHFKVNLYDYIFWIIHSPEDSSSIIYFIVVTKHIIGTLIGLKGNWNKINLTKGA